MPHSHVRARTLAVAFLVLIAITGLVWTRTVEVRVPNHFHGLIRVTSDPAAKPPSIGLFRLVLHVPASGELTIPDLDIIRRFHREVACRFSGSPLPVVLPGDDWHGVALHVMNTPPTPQVFYYVGTREELLRFLAEAHDRLYSVHAPKA